MKINYSDGEIERYTNEFKIRIKGNDFKVEMGNIILSDEYVEIWDEKSGMYLKIGKEQNEIAIEGKIYGGEKR